MRMLKKLIGTVWRCVANVYYDRIELSSSYM